MSYDIKMTEATESNASKRPREDEDEAENDGETKVARQEGQNDVHEFRSHNPDRDRSFPKKKILVLFGYLGAAYQGLQRNPGAVTVESVLEKAIVAAGGISADNAGSFQKVNWQSCARTDKGVSAVGNCIALKAISVPDLKDKINEHLPKDIHVFATHRTTAGFNPKERCSGRKYYYLVPTYVFAPKGSNYSEFKFTSEHRDAVNEVLKEFEGTHHYHNLTSGGGPKTTGDPAAQRLIFSFTCGEPFATEDGEWVQLTVHGQSFVYNQIRKMVALVICIIRDGQTKRVVNSVFQRRKKVVPLAPALGLFLFRAYFEYYNKDVKPPAEVLTFEDSLPAMEDFKTNQILPHIIRANKADKVYASWLATFDEFPVDYDDLMENDFSIPPKESHYPRSFYEDEKGGGRKEDD